VAVGGGRLKRFSKSCGRIMNSLKMALAPALLRTAANLVMALRHVLIHMVVVEATAVVVVVIPVGGDA
jgi:hypothetical protein